MNEKVYNPLRGYPIMRNDGRSKMKCIIEGCENKSELIFKPLMSSDMYCKKHFDEIYCNERGEEE